MRRAHPDDRPTTWIRRTIRRTPPGVYVAVVLPVAVTIMVTASQPWMPASDLLRDSQVVAAAHAGSSPAYGLVSNLGIVVLALSCGAALLAWATVSRSGAPQSTLLAWAAVLTAVLVLDDLLLLHEAVAFSTWSSALVAAAYGLAFLGFAVRFRDAILRDLDVGLLLITVAGLGVSGVTDVLVSPTHVSVVVEDGAKLLGLVAWAAFVLRAAVLALGRRAAGEARLPDRRAAGHELEGQRRVPVSPRDEGLSVEA